MFLKHTTLGDDAGYYTMPQCGPYNNGIRAACSGRDGGKGGVGMAATANVATVMGLCRTTASGVRTKTIFSEEILWWACVDNIQQIGLPTYYESHQVAVPVICQ